MHHLKNKNHPAKVARLFSVYANLLLPGHMVVVGGGAAKGKETGAE